MKQRKEVIMGSFWRHLLSSDYLWDLATCIADAQCFHLVHRRTIVDTRIYVRDQTAFC